MNLIQSVVQPAVRNITRRSRNILLQELTSFAIPAVTDLTATQCVFWIAKALFAYAVQISLNAGYDGVLIFRAKTSELLAYYTETFGARQVASYDPFRLVIWEDAAADIIADYLEGGVDDGSEKI